MFSKYRKKQTGTCMFCKGKTEDIDMIYCGCDVVTREQPNRERVRGRSTIYDRLRYDDWYTVNTVTLNSGTYEATWIGSHCDSVPTQVRSGLERDYPSLRIREMERRERQRIEERERLVQLEVAPSWLVR